jgi:hypothetical protein
MKLSELRPEFSRGDGGKGYLSFDCPHCALHGIDHAQQDRRSHRIKNLPTFDGEPRNTGVYRWGLTGTPPDWDTVSLTPSVNYDDDHWHGFITNGEVQ